MLYEYVSLFSWSGKANYSLILPKFYLLCWQLQNPCNDNPSLKRAYFYNCSFILYDLNPIWKPQWSTILDSPKAKHYSHVFKCYTSLSSKSPNIARVLEPTVLSWWNIIGGIAGQVSQHVSFQRQRSRNFWRLDILTIWQGTGFLSSWE